MSEDMTTATRAKKPAESKRLSMDKRIKRVLDDSWIAPVYFNAAIIELRNKFNAMSDVDLTKYMEGLISPDAAREHIEEIYEKLNPQ